MCVGIKFLGGVCFVCLYVRVGLKLVSLFSFCLFSWLYMMGFFLILDVGSVGIE